MDDLLNDYINIVSNPVQSRRILGINHRIDNSYVIKSIH